MPTVTFDTKSEIAELEHHLLELQHHLLELKQYILRWSKQDIEKSLKDSDEEHPPRSRLYTKKNNRAE